jgi:phage shock protein A
VDCFSAIAQGPWWTPPRSVRLQPMFKKLRQALDDALSSLEERMGGTSEEDVERLIHAMREELVEAKTRLPELERQVKGMEARRRAELKRAEDAVRRADQADKIGDMETVEVAVRFAEQHKSRAEMLLQKREAAEAELHLKRVEIEEMTRQLKSARSQKDALLMRERRAKTSQRLNEASGSAGKAFDRFEDDLTRDADLAAAREEVERDLGGDDPELEAEFDDLGARRFEFEGDELLEKLKRKMKDDGE